MTREPYGIIERRVPREEHLGQETALRHDDAPGGAETRAQRAQGSRRVAEVIQRIASPDQIERACPEREAERIALHQPQRLLTTRGAQMRQRQVQADDLRVRFHLLGQ